MNIGLISILLHEGLHSHSLYFCCSVPSLSGSLSTLIFIPPIQFCHYFVSTILCLSLLHFSVLGRFSESIFVHLLSVSLLTCLGCVFLLICTVSAVDLDLLFHSNLFDFLSVKIYFILVGLHWCKSICDFRQDELFFITEITV